MKNFNTLLTLSELKEHYGSPPVGICTLYYGKLDKTIVESKTGNPIVLPPYKAITSLNISFSPKQAGSGDPSPENIRPISGWDKVQVTRCGKNLLNVEILKNENAWNQTKTYWSYELKIPDNAQYILSVQKNNMYKDYKSEYNGQFAFYVGNIPGIANPNTKFGNSGSNKSTILKSYTFTKTIEPIYFNLFVTPAFAEEFSSIVFDELLPGIQLELSSTPTSYEPYLGDTYDIALPETVYGGTVDAVTGAGSKTWGYIASYNGESLPGEWISDRDVYASGTTPTTGAQVAYQLATPEPFKVNPISIPSLGGINTIYSDADNLSCDFKISSFWGDAD